MFMGRHCDTWRLAAWTDHRLPQGTVRGGRAIGRSQFLRGLAFAARALQALLLLLAGLGSLVWGGRRPRR
jgi:hypothetical protein